MKQIINKALEDLKSLDIKGCITGSILLGEFEGQDIDLFCYDLQSFNIALFTLYHNKLYQLIDPLEEWKFKKWIKDGNSSYKKNGLVTIKFKYNLAIDVNIILKKNNSNIFSVLSSFDMDIICKGYDIETKQYLDLSQNDGKTAHWNKWNTSYYSPDIWTTSRLLRQFERTIKYWNRGYNTDLVVLKYIELTDGLLEYDNIFNSLQFEEKLEETKTNAKLLKSIFTKWLETHYLTDEETQLLTQKIKEL